MMTSAGVYSGQGADTPHPSNKPVFGSIRDYYYDMSNGQMVFTGGVWNASGGVINWVVLDYNKIDYHNGTRNLRTDVLAKVQNEPTPGPSLIRAIVYAGNEYDGGGLNPSSAGYEYIDSEEFDRPTEIPHESPHDLPNPEQFFKNIGVACHELGHAAFGFPDRYGTYNTLLWDLMGAGQKSGPGNEMACPSTLNPFDRKSETWISFQSFSGTQATKPFAYNYSSPQIFQVAVSGNEYFLVENRRNQLGGSGTFDQFLPEQGILVWHVRNSTGAGIINLIEADNTQSEANLSGDPFPGSSNNTNLNDFTTPNCKYTSSSNTSMVLHYISAPAATMTADLGSKWFGTLPLNLTWSGIVNVGGNVTVPNGKTLTNSAGSLVQFDSGTNLTISGKLVADSNNPSQRITFTGATTTPGFWGGIRINSGNSANVSAMRRCDVKYATTGITVTYTGNSNNVTLDKCRVSNNSFDGIYVYGSSTATVHPTLTNNHIHDNGDSGIYLTNYAKPLAELNRLEYNGDNGILANNWASATVKFNYAANNGGDGMGFHVGSLASVHRNTVRNNFVNGISATTSSDVTAYGATTNDGRNHIYGNAGSGIYSWNCTPIFGKNVVNQYGNNHIAGNTGFEARQQYSGLVWAEQCYWAGQHNDITGNVDNVPYLSTAPTPVGWGQSDTYDPSYLVTPAPRWHTENIDAGDQDVPLAKVTAGPTDFDPTKWLEKFEAAMKTGLEKGEWTEATEAITQLWRELQDTRVPALDFKSLTDYAEKPEVNSSVRKYLALALTEKSLAVQDITKALDDLAKYRGSNAAHTSELLANSGFIHLHFQNDVAAAENILSQLHALAAQSDERASALEKLLSTSIEKYRQLFGNSTASHPDGNASTAITGTEASILAENYPNTFNPETRIRYHVFGLDAQEVSLIIFNTLGQRVRTLATGKQEPGSYTVQWDGRNDLGQELPSGMYLLRAGIGAQVSKRKLMLLR